MSRTSGLLTLFFDPKEILSNLIQMKSQIEAIRAHEIVKTAGALENLKKRGKKVPELRH